MQCNAKDGDFETKPFLRYRHLAQLWRLAKNPGAGRGLPVEVQLVNSAAGRPQRNFSARWTNGDAPPQPKNPGETTASTFHDILATRGSSPKRCFRERVFPASTLTKEGGLPTFSCQSTRTLQQQQQQHHHLYCGYIATTSIRCVLFLLHFDS